VKCAGRKEVEEEEKYKKSISRGRTLRKSMMVDTICCF
jgi:hypothetical protein